MPIRRPLALAGPGSPGRAGGLARGRLPRRSRCRVPGREPADLQPDAPAGLSPGRAGGHDRPHRDLCLGGGGGPGAGGPRTGMGGGRAVPCRSGAPHPPFGHPLPGERVERPGWRRSGWRWRRSGTRPRPDRRSTAGTAWAGVPSSTPRPPPSSGCPWPRPPWGLRVSSRSPSGSPDAVASTRNVAGEAREWRHSWSPHSSWPRAGSSKSRGSSRSGTGRGGHGSGGSRPSTWPSSGRCPRSASDRGWRPGEGHSEARRPGRCWWRGESG